MKFPVGSGLSFRVACRIAAGGKTLLLLLAAVAAQADTFLRVEEGISGELAEIAIAGRAGERVPVRIEGLDVAVESRSGDKAGVVIAHFRNKGDSVLRLEVALCKEVAWVDEQSVFWDGSTATARVGSISEQTRMNNIRRMAPWTGVYSADRTVVLGVNPRQLLGFIESSYVPPTDALGAQLEFRTRIVLSPGQELNVEFFHADFKPFFSATREIVGLVHDLYPQAFKPNEGVHKGALGPSAHYWMSRRTIESVPGHAPIELMRRLNATWDWSYAPFKRTGDHWGHEDLWDYEPINIPFAKDKKNIVQNDFYFSDITRDQFMQMRQTHYNSNGAHHGMLFFSPGSVWCEIQLANERYPDARIIDPNYRYELVGWVTHHDREVKLFPWFTSYEPVLKADFKKIAETYDISGIALDVARGGPKYRGPATQKPVAGRAFDDEGIYLDQSIGIAHVIDYLHTLPVRHDPRYHLAVLGNPEVGGQTFTLTSRYDAAMFEGPPWNPAYTNIELNRFMLGEKPLNWWSGYMYHRYLLPNWKSQTREEFIDTMSKAADYLIFRSFELAVYPTTNYQFGMPKVTRIMPDLRMCVERGWEAVVPAKFDDTYVQHAARYGEGLQTVLFWGNPNTESVPFTADVYNEWLGAADYLFGFWRGNAQKLDNVLEGSVTRLGFELNSRVPFLQVPVLELPRGTAVSARVGSIRNLFHYEVEVELMPAHTGPLTMRAPVVDGYLLEEIRSGEAVTGFTADADGYAFALDLVGGKAETILLVYTSKDLRFGKHVAESLRFFSGANDLVVDFNMDQLDADARAFVQKPVDEYLRYFRREVLGLRSKAPAQSAKPERVISYSIDPTLEDTSEGVFLAGNGTDIEVRATDKHRALELTNRLLEVHDERFPHHPGFQAAWGMHGDVLRHFNMVNRNIEE